MKTFQIFFPSFMHYQLKAINSWLNLNFKVHSTQGSIIKLKYLLFLHLRIKKYSILVFTSLKLVIRGETLKIVYCLFVLSSHNTLIKLIRWQYHPKTEILEITGSKKQKLFGTII